MDPLELLTLDQALNTAYKVNIDVVLEAVNAADYIIKNGEIVYINGLWYYRFSGYGINIRGYNEGYALAIDIENSSVSEQLLKHHSSFSIKRSKKSAHPWSALFWNFGGSTSVPQLPVSERFFGIGLLMPKVSICTVSAETIACFASASMLAPSWHADQVRIYIRATY